MKKVIIFFLTSIFIFSGCRAEENEEASSGNITAVAGSQVSEESNNDLVLSMRSAITLNPLLNKDESVDKILRILYMPLIGIDETGKPEASIAESWYYTEEGTVLIIKLKQGLKWHDGSTITADDIIYSINTLKNADDKSVYKKSVSDITSCTKTDDYSLEVHFDDAYSSNVYGMCFLPVSKNWVTSGDKDLEPMGNGSYSFESFTAAKEMVLRSSENSFGDKPSIEKIVVKMTTDADTDVYSFSRRITDCVDATESEMGKYDLDSGAKKYSYVSNYYDFIGFNFENELLNDKNIRKAVAYCVPMDSIIDGVYLSNAVRATSPVNPSSWLFDETAKKYDYSLDGAKKYLDLDGYVLNETTGIREKNIGGDIKKLSFTMLVNSENDERMQIAIKLRDELKAVGIELNVVQVDFEEYGKRLENGEFDMFLGGWEMSVDPYIGFMLSSRQIENGGNYISYNSEKMDTLLAAAYSAVSNTAIVESYKNLQQEIAEELPYISLVYRKSALFVDDRIGGTVTPSRNNCYKTIGQWSMN